MPLKSKHKNKQSSIWQIWSVYAISPTYINRKTVNVSSGCRGPDHWLIHIMLQNSLAHCAFFSSPWGLVESLWDESIKTWTRLRFTGASETQPVCHVFLAKPSWICSVEGARLQLSLNRKKKIGENFIHTSEWKPRCNYMNFMCC